MKQTMCWRMEDDNGILVIAARPEDFRDMRHDLATAVLDTPCVNYGRWQSKDVSKSTAHDTYELRNVTAWYAMPQNEQEADLLIDPDAPWAEAHFQERVGGKAINPGVEHANWPHHGASADLHLKQDKYDHNYMERIWPKDLWIEGVPALDGCAWSGYRFPIGDLRDVAAQLINDPGTRQAYLPIWFPEDTGATEGQRVPCTLGYHFIIRDNKLHLTYNMRSCEIYRHFTNDVYMAVRLAQWMTSLVNEELDVAYSPGQLTMNITSLHGFRADTDKIKDLI